MLIVIVFVDFGSKIVVSAYLLFRSVKVWCGTCLSDFSVTQVDVLSGCPHK